MEKISPPVRIFTLLLVLVGVAGMVAMRTMASSDEPVAIPAPVKAAKAQPVKAQTAKAQPAKVAASVPAATAKRAAKPKSLNPVVPPTGFPVAVDKALRTYEVVVVSLVVPGAKVDELAAMEAQAGAKLGGAGFLALNVLNEDVARALLAKLDVAEDPSVLVLKRSGEVAVELRRLRRPRNGRPGCCKRGLVSTAATAPRELFVRHARKDGRSVAVLRAIDHGDSCVVETEVYPVGSSNAAAVRSGPYTFANAADATQFVTEAVEALMVLGCDVQAQ